MMIKKTHITKLAILVGCQLLAIPSYAQSLEQAIAATLINNPDIKSSYNEFMTKNEGIRQSQGQYLPSVDLEAGVGYEDYDDDPSGTNGDFNPHYAQISIRQLIWDGSSTYNDIQRNKSETEAQRYQLLADAQDTALSTVQAYLDVIEAQQVVKLSQANIEVHNRILKDIQKRTDSGLSSTADLIQVQGRVASANTNLLSAQSNLNDKITAFVRVTGEYPKDLKKPQVDANFLPTTLEDALKKAKANNPTLHVAYHDILAAKSQYNQDTGTMLPTFTVEGSQKFGDELDGDGRNDVDELKVMLKMNYNLYNGGSDAAKGRAAAYQLTKAKDIRDKAYQMLEQSTRLSWSARDLASAQEKYLEQHVDSAAKTIIAYGKQYKIGKRTLLDLLNTENELFDSRKAYLAAHYDGVLSNYRLLNSTGLLLNELRVAIPDQWTKSVK
ncbi:TolC family outer membrane protein [Vibrio sp. S11_S32]|uniref:TolC family outer membrane protein n=1 Tax=Vibrio sp. S11_S32 TaxID=2720225 RepID=UPI001EEE67C6|nr:TolC family outer membrane protein [Vibrio sp. S11_S32]